ncbi:MULTISPECIES: ATP-binding protein [Tissierellales]|jgi:serine/threonine-protein kinase RsbW|uniref:Histidine kinase n=1 Tax=Acidilutibacter cellobiosedens TaxID=2507161 RepID=A0A410Q822_9FIRM|nr:MULTISPECIES: ATP-binding protein [Tissierellales]MBE6082927.1 histidine kinase [Tissierellaceae bacterium]QAT60076.1 histidine kinase [Acidilutibacter cellobiosedens]SCL96385.1 Serine-protein kinase RsbW [Sporanaerobacter sp. PP17-6a]
MDKETVELRVPSKPDYVSVIRLTTSAIASNADLNIDDIDDIKVAIAEACINALDKSEEIYIKYEILQDKLIIFVKNVSEKISEDISDKKERELGILIIKSLMDEVEFTGDGVKLIKNIEDGIK